MIEPRIAKVFIDEDICAEGMLHGIPAKHQAANRHNKQKRRPSGRRFPWKPEAYYLGTAITPQYRPFFFNSLQIHFALPPSPTA